MAPHDFLLEQAPGLSEQDFRQLRDISLLTLPQDHRAVYKCDNPVGRPFRMTRVAVTTVNDNWDWLNISDYGKSPQFHDGKSKW